MMIEQDFIDKETHKLLYKFHGILHVISVQYRISKIWYRLSKALEDFLVVLSPAQSRELSQ